MRQTGTADTPVTDSAKRRPDWLVVVCIWAVAALVLLVRVQLQPTPLLGDADDAMRLVQAIDLLNGQAWQDSTQYRDNVPYGASMHWSRLIDAPIALLTAMAAPFASVAAPQVAALVWPVLLLLPLLLMSLTLTRRLVPSTDLATPLVLPLVSMVLLIEFLPGRVDHHNVQILLGLVMALCLVSLRDRTVGGAIAGLAAATSLAIGMETLLVLAVVTSSFVLLWVAEPHRYRASVTAYGMALALGAIGHLTLAVAPATFLAPACDALSIVYVLPAFAGGSLLAGAAWLATGLRSPWHRLAAMIILGATTLAATAVLFPQCLDGPYAGVAGGPMAVYFDDIIEAQSLLERLRYDASTGIAFALSILVAVGVTAWRTWRERGESRLDWLLVLALLTASTLVMLVQMRGARIAAPFMIPAAAWVITSARRTHLAERNPRSTLSLLGSWLLFAGVAHYAVANLVIGLVPSTGGTRSEQAASERGTDCKLESAYRSLAALPPGRVIVPLPLGAQVLVHTPHSVVAAGFHRNVQGIEDTGTFVAGDEAIARQIAEVRQLDYVVVCPGAMPDGGVIGPVPGQPWPWLSPLSDPTETLQVYRITR